MTTSKAKQAETDDQPVEEPQAEEQPQEQTQVPEVPAAAEREAGDFTEPSPEGGLFPGDPNTYPDPDNPVRSP